MISMDSATSTLATTAIITRYEESLDHRGHRPGRRLPRGVPPRQGVRGAWREAPHLALQHRPHRPPLPGPPREGPALHPAPRRHDGQLESHARDPAGPARRDLQPRHAVAPRGELLAARVHGQLRGARTYEPA